MKPTLVYDGECGFCRCWVEKIHRLIGDAVDYRPYQEYREAVGDAPAGRFNFEEAVHWVEGGTVLRGAEAVYRALEFARWPFCRFGAWARAVPGGMALSRWGYEVVSGHRPFFSRLTRCFCRGSD